MPTSFDGLTQIARQNAESKGELYETRLEFEIKEIVKQGAELNWIKAFDINKKITKNPAKLVLPYLLGMTEVDPVDNPEELVSTVKVTNIVEYKKQHGKLPPGIIKDNDMPDIDIDCISEAREVLKQYAIEKYSTSQNELGIGSVCAVGTWQTYKFKSAIVDTAVVTSHEGKLSRYEVERFTTQLPETVDELKEGGLSACKGMVQINNETKECGTKHDQLVCPNCGSADTEGPTLQKLLEEFEILRQINHLYPKVIDIAKNLIGKIRNAGTHAAALIITNRNLFGNIPLQKTGKRDIWSSTWTEGQNAQLSKWGYVKWDWLGLKTLDYVFTTCLLISQNRGISFGTKLEGWEYIDPANKIGGYFFDANGDKHFIRLDDPHAFALANTQKTDAIFQFDTDLAKSILQNGVTSFDDLMLLNAMGHPGPIDSIPEAMENRDGKVNWQKQLHPEIFKILKDTYGIIVYQEQLAAIWMKLGGFTAPEAQEARKAVAKKWTHKLKPIREKWLAGAKDTLGANEAARWWDKMETFGRYAFNKCLDKDTILTDIKTNETHTIEEWKNLELSFTLNSFDNGIIVPDTCVDIHDTGIQEVFEVEFDNETKERVTLDHKFLCTDGEYHTVSDIFNNQLEILEPGSNNDTKIF